MPDKIVRFLDVSCYRNFKGWITDKNNINPVFVASFKHPSEIKAIDMYGKIYPLDFTDRSLFNEIVGYLIANALEIPQPKYACIALIPTQDIAENDNIGFSDSVLGKKFFDNEFYPIFCTSKIDKSETAFEYHTRSKKLIDELAKWSHIGDTIAMDNTIAHVDRHMGNLLRTGKAKYHVIDNDMLVCKYDTYGYGWLTSDLDVDKKYKNQLFDIAKDLMPQKEFVKIRSSMIHECHKHSNAIASINNEVNNWMNSIYSSNSSDYIEFLDFLNKRADNAFEQVTSRVELLI